VDAATRATVKKTKNKKTAATQRTGRPRGDGRRDATSGLSGLRAHTNPDENNDRLRGGSGGGGGEGEGRRAGRWVCMSGQRAASPALCARSLTDSLGGRCSSASASLIQPLRPHSTHASAPNLSLTHTQPTAKMSSTAEEDRIKRVQVRTEEGRQQWQTTIRLRPSLTAALPPSLHSSAASSLLFFVDDRDKQMRSLTSRGERHAQRGDSCSVGRPQHPARGPALPCSGRIRACFWRPPSRTWAGQTALACHQAAEIHVRC
jgi:hypothetical protein